MKNESFFSVNGRLRRKDYFIRVLLLSIPAGFLNVIVSSSQDPGLLFMSGIIMIVCGVLITIQAIKRLHDIGLSGWLWLVSLVPLVNLIFGLYLLFKDGIPGQNEYGADPKGRFAG